MTMQQKIEQFKAALKKMKAYQHAMGEKSMTLKP